MTDSHVAEGATRSTAIYALFIIRRPSFFRGYSSIAGVAFVPKSSLTSSAVFTCISATGESLDVLVLSAAHGSRARPWLKAVDFSLLVGACVAFLGGVADSCVARCAQPMHGSHSRPGGFVRGLRLLVFALFFRR